eukprot:SAG31_NODE_6433_length_2022_cov_2.040562_2_plen_190_part_00
MAADTPTQWALLRRRLEVGEKATFGAWELLHQHTTMAAWQPGESRRFDLHPAPLEQLEDMDELEYRLEIVGGGGERKNQCAPGKNGTEPWRGRHKCGKAESVVLAGVQLFACPVESPTISSRPSLEIWVAEKLYSLTGTMDQHIVGAYADPQKRARISIEIRLAWSAELTIELLRELLAWVYYYARGFV